MALMERQSAPCCRNRDTVTTHCRYFVAFTFDTTLGVALAIAFHTLALNAAKYNASGSQFAARVAECGSYGETHSMLRYTPRQNIASPSGSMLPTGGSARWQIRGIGYSRRQRQVFTRCPLSRSHSRSTPGSTAAALALKLGCAPPTATV